MRPWYRARQFWQALTAAPEPGAPPELAPGLCDLYLRMPPADQAHGLRTYRLLALQQHTQDLLIAALLHDAGKSTPEIHLWDRVIFVLAGRLAPAWLARLDAGRPGIWSGLVALRDHAGRGARMVADAGGPPRVVRLIQAHHSDPADLAWPDADRALLAALQAADEAS